MQDLTLIGCCGISELTCDTVHCRACVAMNLQAPALTPCTHHPRIQHQPVSSRISAARRCHTRSARTLVADTTQLIDQDIQASSQDQLDVLSRSQPDSAPAEPDMGSRLQIPRNKVLTTNMIAHATNQNVSQVNASLSLSHWCHSKSVSIP